MYYNIPRSVVVKLIRSFTESKCSVDLFALIENVGEYMSTKGACYPPRFSTGNEPSLFCVVALGRIMR